jgi:hypothetical protein
VFLISAIIRLRGTVTIGFGVPRPSVQYVP